MDKIVLPEVIAEHVLRVEVSGGFVRALKVWTKEG